MKIMAKDRENKNNRGGKESPAKRKSESNAMSTKDNIRLILGFIFVIYGAFLACSIISYLFYWKLDMSALMETNPRVDVVYSNICGPMGARVAQTMVGGRFGIFALAVPAMFTVLGWRLFRFKPVRLHRLIIVYALVAIMGSLTLGATFDTMWNLFGTGIGGGYGIALSDWLTANIGFVGTLLVIIAGWIATGIIINRNFLHLLGNAMVKGYERCMVAAQELMARVRSKRESAENVVERVVEDNPIEEVVEVQRDDDVPPVVDDDPFTVVPADEEVVEKPEEDRTIEDDDDPFTVVPRDEDVKDITPVTTDEPHPR